MRATNRSGRSGRSGGGSKSARSSGARAPQRGWATSTSSRTPTSSRTRRLAKPHRPSLPNEECVIVTPTLVVAAVSHAYLCCGAHCACPRFYTPDFKGLLVADDTTRIMALSAEAMRSYSRVRRSVWLVVALALAGRVCAALLTLLTRNNVDCVRRGRRVGHVGVLTPHGVPTQTAGARRRHRVGAAGVGAMAARLGLAPHQLLDERRHARLALLALPVPPVPAMVPLAQPGTLQDPRTRRREPRSCLRPCRWHGHALCPHQWRQAHCPGGQRPR